MTASRSRVPGQPVATLRFDSACAFCTASARFIEARTRGRVHLEAAPGIEAAELIEGGALRRGGAAMTGALALVGPRWARLAGLLDARGVHLLRDAAYACIVRARWPLPLA
ncbi:MAG: hypothetical protein U0360_03105 [Dehalococcoidia bacterium]